MFSSKLKLDPRKSNSRCSFAAVALGLALIVTPVWGEDASSLSTDAAAGPINAAVSPKDAAAPPKDAVAPSTGAVAPPTGAAATPTENAATTAERAPVKVQTPFPVAGKFSRTVQTVTGINLLTGVVSSEVAKHVIQHKLGGKVKVKIRTYSFTDTLAGKIKSVSIQTDGCKIKDVPLGQVSIKSENPIWYDYHRKHGHKPGLNQAVAMTVKAQVDQQQVARALSTEAVSKSLRGLKLDLPGLGEQQLQILNPKVKLAGEKIKIDATLVTLGADPETGVAIVISAKPVLQGAKIMLEEMEVASPDIEDPAAFAKFAQDLFNPIFDLGKFDRADHAFRLTNFGLTADKVVGNGSLLLVPRNAIADANKNNK